MKCVHHFLFNSVQVAAICFRVFEMVDATKDDMMLTQSYATFDKLGEELSRSIQSDNERKGTD